MGALVAELGDEETAEDGLGGDFLLRGKPRVDVRDHRLPRLRDHVPLHPGPVEERLLRDVVLRLACHDAPRTADALVHRNPEPPQRSCVLLLLLTPRGERLQEGPQDASRKGERGKEIPEKRSTVHHSASGRWG